MRRDAATFVGAVRDRLVALGEHDPGGAAPVAVVAWDTELFGHWWHEGPQFLEQVLRMLPEAGVRHGDPGAGRAGQARPRSVDLPAGSWGAGKDLRLWAGPAVADLAADARAVADRMLHVVRRCCPPGSARASGLDDLVREGLLALASDWAFMVSRDSAAGVRARPARRPTRPASTPSPRRSRAGGRTPAGRRTAHSRPIWTPACWSPARTVGMRRTVAGADPGSRISPRGGPCADSSLCSSSSPPSRRQP